MGRDHSKHLPILVPAHETIPLALFPHAESDYTSYMRVGVKFLGLWCLLAPAFLSAADRAPHELYDAISALRVDPSAIYHIAPANRIEFRRGDAVLSLEEGTLAFFSTLDGRRSEEHTSELQSRSDLVCRLLLEKK